MTGEAKHTRARCTMTDLAMDLQFLHPGHGNSRFVAFAQGIGRKGERSPAEAGLQVH